MTTADINYQDFTATEQQRMDERLLVRFFIKPVENKAATLEEGRPMFKEVEYIEIRIPGNRDAQACRPATFADKNRFPKHYEAWQKRQELPTEGTPLIEWPQISRSQVEELAFVNCKTVEQLSEVADSAIGTVRGGYMLKQKAQQWLVSSEKSKLLSEKLKMEGQIKELEKTVAMLAANAKKTTRAKPKITDE